MRNSKVSPLQIMARVLSRRKTLVWAIIQILHLLRQAAHSRYPTLADLVSQHQAHQAHQTPPPPYPVLHHLWHLIGGWQCLPGQTSIRIAQIRHHHQLLVIYRSKHSFL